MPGTIKCIYNSKSKNNVHARFGICLFILSSSYSTARPHVFFKFFLLFFLSPSFSSSPIYTSCCCSCSCSCFLVSSSFYFFLILYLLSYSRVPMHKYFPDYFIIVPYRTRRLTATRSAVLPAQRHQFLIVTIHAQIPALDGFTPQPTPARFDRCYTGAHLVLNVARSR